MHIFKTSGIVLGAQKSSEKEMLYTIFFKDYGVLLVSKKKKAKERAIDTGYCIQCEIITKANSNIHTIGNIKIIDYYSPVEKPYSEVESFLSLISYIKKNLPKESPHFELHDAIWTLILLREKINSEKVLLIRLKAISLLGNLGDTHKDITTQKILKFIHTHGHKDILRLGKIPEDTIYNLEKYAKA